MNGLRPFSGDPSYSRGPRRQELPAVRLTVSLIGPQPCLWFHGVLRLATGSPMKTCFGSGKSPRRKLSHPARTAAVTSFAYHIERQSAAMWSRGVLTHPVRVDLTPAFSVEQVCSRESSNPLNKKLPKPLVSRAKSGERFEKPEARLKTTPSYC